ncbi:imidazole glycerol phosphate synthase subunit HisH [Bdellovibrio reynosensis]|uniref:Imidazole glycerol phosphate synthase subunit HisH n=1 Tax=Bdellovibrio reynosensis TaxID=2835041 RepID=A0ABY4CBT3_9BACT|nr:imidazole glycerol phosphate synthase subunit HisH [Bdellovibrio reynosensis]UOF02239.1 imidazole glycerol phosphate synthase subunit HisH [Bdellovibrio reynosensis]
MIGILDYGVGNIRSIDNIIRKVGGSTILVKDLADLKNVQKLILPGVGHFASAMKELKSRNGDGLIREYVKEGKPLLGICLGMQLLFDRSEEGDAEGLGIISGEVKKFNLPPKLKVPHVGFNRVNFKSSKLMDEESVSNNKFYFTHSYFCVPTDAQNILGTTNYGIEFTSAVQTGNVYGVQFHPEKSHVFGMKLMKAFWEMK